MSFRVHFDAGKEYVPEFNSIVAFKVPRYHEVTAVTSRRPRLSIFGWFLQPGKLYELYTGEEKVAAERREIFREHGTTRVVANGVKAKGIAENGAGGRKRRSESNIEVEDRAAKDSGAALKQQVDGSSGNVPQCKLAQRIIANAAKQKKKKKR